MLKPSEAELIRRAADGDRVALTELFLLHYAQLYQHITYRLSQETQAIVLAEDVLQETFFRASQSIYRFEDRNGSLLPWLKTIASNLIKDAQKRRRRERRADWAAADTPNPGSESARLPLVERLGANGPSPSRVVRRRDAEERLREALETLPDDQREVLRRYYLLDQSLDQIAQVMARSKDAIRGICYRAKQNLRTTMGSSSQYLTG